MVSTKSLTISHCSNLQERRLWRKQHPSN